MILVSHDRHLLRNTADELLLVHDGVVEEYEEDLRAYEKWILGSYRAGDNAAAAGAPTATGSLGEGTPTAGGCPARTAAATTA